MKKLAQSLLFSQFRSLFWMPYIRFNVGFVYIVNIYNLKGLRYYLVRVDFLFISVNNLMSKAIISIQLNLCSLFVPMFEFVILCQCRLEIADLCDYSIRDVLPDTNIFLFPWDCLVITVITSFMRGKSGLIAEASNIFRFIESKLNLSSIVVGKNCSKRKLKVGAQYGPTSF